MKNVLVSLLIVLALAVSAWGTPISLNTLNTAPTSAGDGPVATWLLGLINTYNGNHDPDLPNSDVLLDFKVNPNETAPTGFPSFGTNTLNITLPANEFPYLVLHWGGALGGTWQDYFLDVTPPDLTDTFYAPGQNGLSSYAFYGPQEEHSAVPEPGTMMLLGAGFLGLAIYGKRRRS